MNLFRNRQLVAPALVVLRVGLGILFILSALSKVRDVQAFAETVQRFEMLPNVLVPYFAAVLSPLEYVVGVSLIVGFFPRCAAGLAALLLVMFTAAVGWNLSRSNIVPCGCFDFFMKSEISISVLVRNLILSGVSIGLAFTRIHILSLSQFLSKFQRLRAETALGGWPLNSPVTGFGVFLLGTFILLMFIGGIPERPIVKRAHSEKKIVSNVDAAYLQGEATPVSSLQYGERLPDFVVHDFKGNIVRSDWLKDSVSVFCSMEEAQSG